MLDLLSIERSIVTIDAMGCPKKIAQEIISRKADYILALKDNQPGLYEEIVNFFNRHKVLKYKGRGYDFKHFEETDKGHGRIEVRKCTVIDQLSWMNEKDKWRGIKSIVMIESTRMIGDKAKQETRYYITSLAAEPVTIAHGVRSDWGIENSLHWVLDVSFNEDQSRIRKGYAPQNIAIVGSAQLTVSLNNNLNRIDQWC